MVHLKFTRRLHQTRGTSMLSGVLMRISALKEYEDAELTAARIAAALGLYIRKGDGQDYEDVVTNKDNDREIQIRGGAATESDWVRASGRNPDDVKRRRKAEIDENRRLELVFDTDPACDKGGGNAETERVVPRRTEGQPEE